MGLFSFTFESLGTPERKKVILALSNLGKRHSGHFTQLHLLILFNLVKILQQPNGVEKSLDFQIFLPSDIVVTNEEMSAFIYGTTTLYGSFMSCMILILFTSFKNLFQRDLGCILQSCSCEYGGESTDTASADAFTTVH